MRVLLTGASGVLGAVVARELARHDDVVCLRRSRRVDVVGVRHLSGDLSRPRLGLDPAAWRDLAAEVDVVVHCGAMTGFGTDDDEARAVNVEGTRRVLDLVAAAQARLVHVSTAFVARIEAFSCGAAVDVRTPVGYLRSKIEAEELVTASGLPADIVRPSVLMGHSVTGEIGQFQGWHAMCGAVITGRQPFFPAAETTLIDCVPVDHAARAVAAVARRGDAPGQWWLTAGTSAMTLGESADLALDVAAEHGLPAPRPRFLPREMVERLVLPAFGPEAPRALRQRMVEGMELMRLFGATTPFPSAWPVAADAPPPTPADLRRCARACMRYWCEQQGQGSRAVPDTAAAGVAS